MPRWAAHTWERGDADIPRSRGRGETKRVRIPSRGFGPSGSLNLAGVGSSYSGDRDDRGQSASAIAQETRRRIAQLREARKGLPVRCFGDDAELGTATAGG